MNQLQQEISNWFSGIETKEEILARWQKEVKEERELEEERELQSTQNYYYDHAE